MDGADYLAQNIFTFSADAIDDDIIDVEWMVDGVAGLAGIGPALDIRAMDLDPAADNFITARAFDPTPWVRIEKDKLEQTVRWKLETDPTQTIDGGAAGDTLLGAFTHDLIRGGAAGDTLIGYFGNDTLDGGTNPEGPAGQGDVMLGGDGDDTYMVDTGLDLVDEGFIFPSFGSGGVDTIISTSDFYWDTQSVGENLAVSEDVVDDGDDGVTVVGGIFDNTISGHAGIDILFGRGGSDIYRGGDGVDWYSLSLLGTDGAYPGIDGINTVIVEQGATGPLSYEIIFEFEAGKDKVDVSDYAGVNGLTSGADVIARAVNDGLGNSYIVLGDGLDYVYMVGLEVGELVAGDFVIA
jgi:Ca2+-binding RTX toxin-like protein